jgi:cyclophilin family peptidyl-prolyl cis-trans isomerase
VWILLSQVKLVWQIKTMKKLILIALSLGVFFGATEPVFAQNKPAAKTQPSPAEIVVAAPATDWTAIAPSDLLVMDLAADSRGKPRRVVIQLMPPPFSQGWIGNIRKLAAAKFWDGTSVNRVQDNYVVQWGDANAEDAAKAKKLPNNINAMIDPDYGVYMPEMDDPLSMRLKQISDIIEQSRIEKQSHVEKSLNDDNFIKSKKIHYSGRDSYVDMTGFIGGWPIAADSGSYLWPVHCYGMVGVGRNLSPDTGTGAELYTVIGHAPRHLDRNIALVGRVIEGMEHLSSLPRGTGALGFYETPEERTTILSVRLMSDMPSGTSLPQYEYLSTESTSFSKYADARANRRDPFFIQPADGADICNIPVPVRRVKQTAR